MYNYISNYKGRTDLVDLYGDNSLLLYALQLRYDIEDIISVASEALTDGSDDKKCDLIYIDRDSGFAVVAQAYMKKNPTETDLAKVNKASDLNTAASWIFTRDINDIPDRIKDSVSELQEAIKDGDINTVYFWYVHNMNEKNNPEVQEELNTVQIAAQKLVNNLAGDNSVKIVSLEVGNDTIERWYNSSSKRITIEEEIDVEGNGKAFEIKGGKWKSCVTAVKGSWIRKLYLMYKDDLFSGNPRNYLGAGKRKNKIFKVILYCIIAALIVGIIAIGIVYSLKSKKDETEIKEGEIAYTVPADGEKFYFVIKDNNGNQLFDPVELSMPTLDENISATTLPSGESSTSSPESTSTVQSDTNPTVNSDEQN